MAATFDLLASQDITGSTFSFTGFSGSYTDLMLQVDFTSTQTNVDVSMRFNDATSPLYYALQGGSIVSSGYKTAYWNGGNEFRFVGVANSAGTTPSSFEFYIPMYNNNVTKNGFYTFGYHILPTSNTGNVGFGAWQWNSTNTITKITMFPTGGNLTGRASLYGITGANA